MTCFLIDCVNGELVFLPRSGVWSGDPFVVLVFRFAIVMLVEEWITGCIELDKFGS